VVISVEAPIGMVVVDSIATAYQAVAFIENDCIAYEDLPAIATIEEVIKQAIGEARKELTGEDAWI